MKKQFINFCVLLSLSTLALVGCKKDSETNSNPNPTPSSTLGSHRAGAGVTDVQGNVYNSVIITVSTGKSTQAIEQEWMTENLKSTKYANGTDIDQFKMTTCNEDTATVGDLGYLYDWNALMNNSTVAASQGACPDGWHVPTLTEYNTLITALGGNTVAGKKLKSIDTTYWDDVALADNSSGFSALGGGYNMQSMVFYYKSQAKFWTSTEEGANAREIQIQSNSASAINLYGSPKMVMSSCRCIKD